MNVSDAIRTKRAVRKFQEKPLTKEIVTAILNAGRRSQSSKNEQTWHFIAIQDKKILQALSECGQFAGHIAGAALAVAILTPEPTAKFQTMFDAGQAAAFMQLAAWELGSRLVPGFDLRAGEGAHKYWDSHLNFICVLCFRLAILLRKKS